MRKIKEKVRRVQKFDKGDPEDGEREKKLH